MQNSSTQEKSRETRLIEIALSVFSLGCINSIEKISILREEITNNKHLEHLDAIEKNLESIRATFDTIVKQLLEK